jgi:hypothetical protein
MAYVFIKFHLCRIEYLVHPLKSMVRVTPTIITTTTEGYMANITREGWGG